MELTSRDLSKGKIITLCDGLDVGSEGENSGKSGMSFPTHFKSFLSVTDSRKDMSIYIIIPHKFWNTQSTIAISISISVSASILVYVFIIHIYTHTYIFGTGV
jgi:hypothetical protein